MLLFPVVLCYRYHIIFHSLFSILLHESVDVYTLRGFNDEYFFNYFVGADAM